LEKHRKAVDRVEDNSGVKKIGMGLVLAIAIIVAIPVLVVVMLRNADANESRVKARPAAVESYEIYATSLPLEATPAPTPYVNKLGDKINAGKFGLLVASATVSTRLKSDIKTEDQFITVKLTLTNNDTDPRDISSNMFKLTDGDGRTYKAYSVTGDDFLYYETINPGLSRSRSVAFETPKGIAGLSLVADSGVALAGGEYVTVDLGQ
jgi:hypothetical protein